MKSRYYSLLSMYLLFSLSLHGMRGSRVFRSMVCMTRQYAEGKQSPNYRLPQQSGKHINWEAIAANYYAPLTKEDKDYLDSLHAMQISDHLVDFEYFDELPQRVDRFVKSDAWDMPCEINNFIFDLQSRASIGLRLAQYRIKKERCHPVLSFVKGCSERNGHAFGCMKRYQGALEEYYKYTEEVRRFFQARKNDLFFDEKMADKSSDT